MNCCINYIFIVLIVIINVNSYDINQYDHQHVLASNNIHHNKNDILLEDKSKVGIVTTIISEAIGGIDKVLSYRDTQKSKRSASKTMGLLSQIPRTRTEIQMTLQYLEQMFKYFQKTVDLSAISVKKKSVDAAMEKAQDAASKESQVLEKERPKSSTLENLGGSVTEKIKKELGDNKLELAGRAVMTGAEQVAKKVVPFVNIGISVGKLGHTIFSDAKEFKSSDEVKVLLKKMKYAECLYLKDVVNSLHSTIKTNKGHGLDYVWALEIMRAVSAVIWKHRCGHLSYRRDLIPVFQLPADIAAKAHFRFPSWLRKNEKWIISTFTHAHLIKPQLMTSPLVKHNEVQFVKNPKGYHLNVIRVICKVQQDNVGSDDIIISVHNGNEANIKMHVLGEFNSGDSRSDRHMFVPLSHQKDHVFTNNDFYFKLQEVDNESTDHDFLGSARFKLSPSGRRIIRTDTDGIPSIEWVQGKPGEYHHIKIHFNSDKDVYISKAPSYFVTIQFVPVY